MMHALALVVLLAGTPELIVRGQVRDQSNLVVRDALVYLSGSAWSTTTDREGRFALTLPSGTRGTLMVYLDGFEPASVPLDGQEPAVPLAITLTAAQVRESVSVEGAVPPVPAPSRSEMRALDIVRTPGAAADVLRALQTLPGVTQVEEGAGLFVRGGDASEVTVLLDGVTLFHPYRMETPTGGLFGAVSPFLLQGLSFATGGFSARHGNALSGVLEMTGLERPTRRRLAGMWGLAGSSVEVAIPVGDRAGVRASATRTSTDLLFAVNGSPWHFAPPPSGWDVNAAAYWESSRAGSFKLFATILEEETGVEIYSLDYRALLRTRSERSLVGLRWRRGFGPRTIATASAGYATYARDLATGVMDLRISDPRGSWRLDVEHLSDAWTIRTGVDGDWTAARIEGRVPTTAGDYDGTEGVDRFTAGRRGVRLGGHLETEYRRGRTSLVLGARGDRHAGAAGNTLAPRASLLVRTWQQQVLRVAWGRYHQAQDLYSETTPGGTLPPMQATHLVVGYEAGRPDRSFYWRAEAYWKRYAHLPLTEGGGTTTAMGYGRSSGLDLFVQHRWPRADLRAAYTWLRAERRATTFQDRNRFELPAGTWAPDFLVPHTLSVSARRDLAAGWSVSAAWKVASGRPFTPVVGTRSTPAGLVPALGTVNSERLPHYQRLDAAVTCTRRIIPGVSTVFYASVNNVLGRRNVVEYAYSSDFGSRVGVASGAPRMVAIGVMLSK